jgi:hypothetical protein
MWQHMLLALLRGTIGPGTLARGAFSCRWDCSNLLANRQENQPDAGFFEKIPPRLRVCSLEEGLDRVLRTASGVAMAPLALGPQKFGHLVSLCRHVQIAHWPETIDLRAFLALRALPDDRATADRVCCLSDAEAIVLALAIEKAQAAASQQAFRRNESTA